MVEEDEVVFRVIFSFLATVCTIISIAGLYFLTMKNPLIIEVTFGIIGFFSLWVVIYKKLGKWMEV